MVVGLGCTGDHVMPAMELPSGGSDRDGGSGDGDVAPHATISYYVESASPVEVVVNDGLGNLVKRLDGTGDAGLNSVVWDLSRDGAAPTGGSNHVLPSTYTVVVTAGGNSTETTVEVRR